MNQKFFTNLPSEIVIDILSRLPVRTIIHCKCVCKSWLGLVDTHEFAKSHLSKSVQGLAVFRAEMGSASLKIFEFEERLDLEHHELHYISVTKFDFPYVSVIEGSSNGLLFLRNSLRPHDFYVCNPITRDYIKLHCENLVWSNPQVVNYRFEASKITGQHKVVRISHDCTCYQETNELRRIPKSECQVYTLGTGSWRRIAPDAPFWYDGRTTGAFLSGSLHWLVFDLNDCPWISCFDLETELFSTFSSPLVESRGFHVGIVALGDCLCLCDDTSDGKIVMWLMKEYGVETSWTKEFVIRRNFAGEIYRVVYPIKVFKDGDILMAWGNFFLFYHSEKNKTSQRIDIFEPHTYINAILHTSSFLSLKSFVRENVSSF